MNGLVRAQPDALAGIALLTAALAGFAMLHTATKAVSLGILISMALWCRYAFQAVATTLAVLPKQGWALPSKAHPKLQFLRGRLLLATSGCVFFMPSAHAGEQVHRHHHHDCAAGHHFAGISYFV